MSRANLRDGPGERLGSIRESDYSRRYTPRGASISNERELEGRWVFLNPTLNSRTQLARSVLTPDGPCRSASTTAASYSLAAGVGAETPTGIASGGPGAVGGSMHPATALRAPFNETRQVSLSRGAHKGGAAHAGRVGPAGTYTKKVYVSVVNSRGRGREVRGTVPPPHPQRKGSRL